MWKSKMAVGVAWVAGKWRESSWASLGEGGMSVKSDFPGSFTVAPCGFSTLGL